MFASRRCSGTSRAGPVLTSVSAASMARYAAFDFGAQATNVTACASGMRRLGHAENLDGVEGRVRDEQRAEVGVADVLGRADQDAPRR